MKQEKRKKKHIEFREPNKADFRLVMQDVILSFIKQYLVCMYMKKLAWGMLIQSVSGY